MCTDRDRRNGDHSTSGDEGKVQHAPMLARRDEAGKSTVEGFTGKANGLKLIFFKHLETLKTIIETALQATCKTVSQPKNMFFYKGLVNSKIFSPGNSHRQNC